MIDTPTPDSPQAHNDENERPSQGRLRRVLLISATEMPILCPDTLPEVDAHLMEIEQRQTELLPEVRMQLEQRETVTNVAGGAAIAGIGDILSTVLRYLGNVVMTHILLQSVYGIFVGAFTIVSIIGYAANLGLDSALLRFLSIYRAKDEHSMAAGLIRFVVRVTLISGIFCGAAFFLSATALAHFVYHKDAYVRPFQEIALLVPLIGLQFVLASGLQALKAVKWKVYVDRLIQPGLTLILMGVFYLFGLQLEGVILATVCGYLISVITGQFLLSKAAKQLVRDVGPKFARKTWMQFSVLMLSNSMVANIHGNIDILSLAAFATPAQVGLYAVADRTGLLVLMSFTTLNVVFFPLITEYYAHEEHAQLATMLKLITKWSFSLSLPMFLCFCVFHAPILSVFSRAYIAGGMVLIIISFGNLVFAAASFTLSLLVMIGRPRIVLVNALLAIAVNVVLAVLLVPRFNVVGAAVAVSASLILVSVISIVQVYWIMKLHPFRWDMFKPIVAGGVATGVGYLLLHRLPLPLDERLGTVEALGLIIPFLLAYVLVLALLHFSEEDMIVFRAIRTKLGSFAPHKG